MTKICKTQLLITILHSEHDHVESWNLDKISREMDTGSVIGSVSLLGFVELHPDSIADEERSLGGDGTFFRISEY